ncbi:MAG: nucleoside triphosphate pyrophosphatase [Fibrobacteria bacterium]
MPKVELILASRSPRREDILRMLGLDFTSRAPDFEEFNPPGMDPKAVPEHLARGKAASMAGLGPGKLVLGSDTVVILGDRIMGKPEGAESALEMLTALNGRTHLVVTGVALAREGRILESGAALTEVTFARIPPGALRAYADSQEPLDKAGAYAIQGHGARLVEKVNGCFYNVMGLPIQLTLRMLGPYLDQE